MADLRFIRPRPGARIYLPPADIVSVVLQVEMLAGFTDEETQQMVEALTNELKRRKE